MYRLRQKAVNESEDGGENSSGFKGFAISGSLEGPEMDSKIHHFDVCV